MAHSIPEEAIRRIRDAADIVEVVSCTMRDLKIKVPRSELAQLTNVNELVDLLYKVAGEKAQAAAS